MTRPTIRIARPEDVAAIHAILHEAEEWLAKRGIPMWLPDELRVEPIRDAVERGMFAVAEVEGELAGTVRFQLEDEEYWPDLSPGDSAFVHRLAVGRRFAGRGVSLALLHWAAERARGLGRSWLRLDCDASRQPLRRFYEGAGFRFHSERQVGPHFVARYQMRVDS